MTTAKENNEIDYVYGLESISGSKSLQTIFAARLSGLYKSRDGGNEWVSMFEGMGWETVVPVMALSISPSFASDNTIFCGVNGGVLRSINGGEKWELAPFPPPSPVVTSLAISPGFERDGIILAGTMEDGVFRSADRGDRFYSWNFGLLDLNIISLVLSPAYLVDETIFVGTETGMFRSTNGGRAWREVGDDSQLEKPIDFAPILSLAVSPGYSDDGILLAGTESCGLLLSTDRGNNWKRLGDKVLGNPINSIVLDKSHNGELNILVLAENKLMLSKNGGNSWEDQIKKLGIEQQELLKKHEFSILLAPNGIKHGASIFIGTSDGSVYRI